jgi:hypothetical protein
VACRCFHSGFGGGSVLSVVARFTALFHFINNRIDSLTVAVFMSSAANVDVLITGLLPWPESPTIPPIKTPVL